MREPKTTQAKKAYRSIKEDIITGEFPPGYPLSEVELSEKLEMSRTPVREALHRLKTEGLVFSPRGKGLSVKTFTPLEVCQAYEYGECLEGMAAYLIAQRLSKEDSASLAAALFALEESVSIMEQANEEQDVNRWAEADDAFHEGLRDLCANAFIRAALVQVYGIVHYTRMLITKTRLDKGRSTLDHRRTLDMIKEGRADEARAVMNGHWRRIRDEVMGIIR